MKTDPPESAVSELPPPITEMRGICEHQPTEPSRQHSKSVDQALKPMPVSDREPNSEDENSTTRILSTILMPWTQSSLVLTIKFRHYCMVAISNRFTMLPSKLLCTKNAVTSKANDALPQ